MPSPNFSHGRPGANGFVHHASISDEHTDKPWGATASAESVCGRPLGFPDNIPEPTLLSDLESQSSRSSVTAAGQWETSVVPRVPRAGRLCVKNTFLTVENKQAANLLPRSRTLPTPALLSINEQGEERFGNRRIDDPMYMNIGAPNPGAVGDLTDALGLERCVNVPRPLFLESLCNRRPSPGNSTAQSVSDSVKSQDSTSLGCPMLYNRELSEGWDADSGGLPSPPWQHEDAFDRIHDLHGHPPPLSFSPATSSLDVQDEEVTVSRRVHNNNTFLSGEEASSDMTMIPRSSILPVPSSLSSLDPCDNSHSQHQDGPVLAKVDPVFSSRWSMPACGAGSFSVNSLTEPTFSKGVMSRCPGYTVGIPAAGRVSAAVFLPRMSMFDDQPEEQFAGAHIHGGSLHQPIRITGAHSAPGEPTGCVNPASWSNLSSWL